MSDGVRLMLERRGNPEGPRIFFCHGAGLASRCFENFLDQLAAMHDVFSLDLRGHGWNASKGGSRFDIERARRDFDEVAEAISQQYGRKPLHGVFHSVSAALALWSQADAATFSSLVLYEPALPPPPGEQNALFEHARYRAPLTTRRRRAFYESVEDLQVSLAGNLASRLTQNAARALSAGLLRPAADGGYELCCSPETEASTYEGIKDLDIWPKLVSIDIPVLVLCGRPRGLPEYTSELSPRIADFAKFDLMILDGLDHQGWIAQPQRLASMTTTFIGTLDASSSPPAEVGLQS